MVAKAAGGVSLGDSHERFFLQDRPAQELDVRITSRLQDIERVEA
jgi:hypothetical protein